MLMQQPVKVGLVGQQVRDPANGRSSTPRRTDELA
jgi:hypothetical protein